MTSPRSTPNALPGLERYVASKLPRSIKKWVIYLAAVEALDHQPRPMGTVTAGEMLDHL